ncbi:MAG: pilus assembly protein [Alphaproteobacteria bacterium]|nr:pilus assembly protein [Alphaproteobacteria bacterium]
MRGFRWKKYIRDLSGAIIVAFAIMAPVVIGAAGMALDFSHAYLVQQRLQQAIDAATLAAAGSSTDAEVIEQKVKDFFATNYPPEKLGVTFEPEVTVTDGEVFVTGHAYYVTFFLNVIGIDTIDVGADTTVHREIRGLEVVMVLDNTGSMAENDNINALKEASTSFINILFERAQDPDDIKIGIVPYSNSVRIGRYGLGQNPDGSTYADGDVFVNLPSGVSYTTDHSNASWYGCVVEHEATNYNSAATHVTNSKGQLWSTATGANSSKCVTVSGTKYCRGHGWDPAISTNDTYPDDVLDDYEGPWDIYAFGKVISSGQTCGTSGGYSNSRCSSCSGGGSTCNQTYCYCWKSDSNEGINDGCPYAYVVPLTSDQDALLEAVDPDDPNVMYPHGNTLGNIGMVWGYRMISPEPPFEEGADWDNQYWRKAIVMMTDGDNTENGTYSSYWFTNKNNMTVTKFNQRFAETCEELKEKGVLIYTVTFTSAINDTTKDYYRNCATSEDQYYDAPTQEELIDVFEQISRELSNIYISG